MTKKEIKPLLLTLKQVSETIGLSERSIRRLVADGTFPKPVDMLVQKNFWRASEVTEFVEKLQSRDMEKE